MGAQQHSKLSDSGNTLPRYLTPLVGREADLIELEALLPAAGMRLITLVGGPGVGKTRLAIEAARNASASFDSVALVPLERVREASQLIPMVAQGLDLVAPDHAVLSRVEARLAHGRTLVILDNFEQILTAATSLIDLIHACPGLTALVTSRARLNVRGERVFSVQPLRTPDAAEMRDPAAIASTPAVELFLLHPRASGHPDPSADEMRTIGTLCAELGGVPLSIELAASRSDVLTPAATLEQLRASLDVLSDGPSDLPPRHQSWRRALDWSYDLLAPDAAALFRRLGVCVGGFTAETVDAMCADASSLGHLTALVRHGLVHPVDRSEPEPRYGMLESVRRYAMERLAATGETADAYRLLEHLLPRAEALAEELDGTEQQSAGQWFGTEYENLRALLAHAVSRQQASLAHRLATALWRFWVLRGQLSEGYRWLESVLTLPGAEDDTRAAAHIAAGRLAVASGRHRLALRHYENERRLWRRCGQRLQVARSLTDSAAALHLSGLNTSAGRVAQEALRLYEALGDQSGCAQALGAVGAASWGTGDVNAAADAYQHGLLITQRGGLTREQADLLNALGTLYSHRGEHTDARECYARVLELQTLLGHRRGAAMAHNNLAITCATVGEWEAAADHARQAVHLLQAVQDQSSRAAALFNLALIEEHLTPDAADDHFGECVALYHLLGEFRGVVASLAARAESAVRRGRSAQAAACVVEVLTTRSVVPTERDVVNLAAVLRDAAAAAGRNSDEAQLAALLRDRASADSAPWGAAQRAMLVEVAGRLAALPETLGPARPELDGAEQRLSPREHEVAGLVGEGLPNSGIAERLVISERTVESHVRSIRQKLEMSSRTQLAVWAVANGLTSATRDPGACLHSGHERATMA